MENNNEKILIGSMSELVIKGRNEEEQDAEFMKIHKHWQDKGYNIASGKVSDGKVDELWAIKIK